MKLVPSLTNSSIVASFDLLLALVAFLAFVYPRFTSWGIRITTLTALILVYIGILFLRDLCRAGTRLRALLALMLSLPVLMLYGLLAVWEGPLYVSAQAREPITFQIRGAAGFHGVEVYGPDHRLMEWTSDDIGLLWGFAWNNPQKFPPMNVEFRYGTVPAGFKPKITSLGTVAPPLDPTVTYTLVVNPAMGMPEQYLLRGSEISEFQADPTICWGTLPVAGRPAVMVRIDCVTRKPLSMSARGAERLKAYQDGKLAFF